MEPLRPAFLLHTGNFFSPPQRPGQFKLLETHPPCYFSGLRIPLPISLTSQKLPNFFSLPPEFGANLAWGPSFSSTHLVSNLALLFHPILRFSRPSFPSSVLATKHARSVLLSYRSRFIDISAIGFDLGPPTRPPRLRQRGRRGPNSARHLYIYLLRPLSSHTHRETLRSKRLARLVSAIHAVTGEAIVARPGGPSHLPPRRDACHGASTLRRDVSCKSDLTCSPPLPQELHCLPRWGNGR